MKPALIAAAILASAASRAAENCDIRSMALSADESRPGSYLSGDRFYYRDGRTTWCAPGDSKANQYYRMFDFASADEANGWNGDWGGTAPCPFASPFGRTVAALYLLDTQLPQLFWFARDKINELNADCANGSSYAYTDNCLGRNTRLHMTFFYGTPQNLNNPVWIRASTLFHEARHWDDNCGISRGYRGHWTCGTPGSLYDCDPAYQWPLVDADNELDEARPYSYSVAALVNYARLDPRRTPVPRAFRDHALAAANDVLANRFARPTNVRFWIPPDSAAAPDPCPPGQVAVIVKTNTGDARGDRVQCQPCGPNSQPDASFTRCECSPGYFGDGTTCTACDAGTEQPMAGATSPSACAACPAGTFSAAAGTATCAQCNAGRSIVVGGTKCTPCRGNGVPNAGRTACVDCPGGQIATRSDEGWTCAACPAGSVPDGARARCEVCPAQAIIIRTDEGPQCKLCPPGSAPDAARAVCTGQICQSQGPRGQPGKLICEACPAGLVGNAAGTACVCPGGNLDLGAAPPCPRAPCPQRCQPCAAGSVAAAGASSCAPCSAPFSPNQSGTRCICPEGKVDDGSNTCRVSCGALAFADPISGRCQACPQGQVADRRGSGCQCPGNVAPQADGSCLPY